MDKCSHSREIADTVLLNTEDCKRKLSIPFAVQSEIKSCECCLQQIFGECVDFNHAEKPSDVIYNTFHIDNCDICRSKYNEKFEKLFSKDLARQGLEY